MTKSGRKILNQKKGNKTIRRTSRENPLLFLYIRPAEREEPGRQGSGHRPFRHIDLEGSPVPSSTAIYEELVTSS